MLNPARNPPLLPPKTTAINLFLAGSTLGPIVDSLHNQCLLTYTFAPITLDLPGSVNESTSTTSHLFASSWAVPPLLGFAYLVLGYVLPRIIESVVGSFKSKDFVDEDNISITMKPTFHAETIEKLKTRAILAVSSTAAIIKLSEFLEVHSNTAYELNNNVFILDAKTNLMIMMLADALQWISLDKTAVGLLAATITAIGGPLSELPFVANDFWQYTTEAADYLPLSGTFFESGGIADAIAIKLLGEGYRELALSRITGPCYFAVTLDAIALGRYFYNDSTHSK